MSGGRRQPQPATGRPLDGRVRHRFDREVSGHCNYQFWPFA